MNKLNKKIIFATLALSFVGCAQQNSPKNTLDIAIAQQIVSTNPCESASACSDAFTIALNKYKDAQDPEFCNELVTRKDSDLAVCEVQIRNPKFETLISSCRKQLMSRLDKVVELRNQGLQIHADVYSNEKLGLGFKIPSEVQIRDTSNGYYTVNGGVNLKQVIFTFDDGPEPTNTRSILRTLNEAGVKAHFFELGQRVSESPETAQLVASQGHSIGNHSWNHPNMRTLSFLDGAEQIKRTQSILYKVLGTFDPFFRFPFGNRTVELDKMLAENKMADFYWTVDSNDWRMVNVDGSVRTNLQVVNDTIQQLDRKGRGIILMHDIHRRSAELLPELLRLISQRGYTSVVLQPAQTELKKNPPFVTTGRVGTAQ